MSENHEIIEPNFEGEEMKMPTETAAQIIPEKTGGGVLTGAIIAVLFISLVAILAGLYYWYTIVMSTEIIKPVDSEGQATEQSNGQIDSVTQDLGVVSTSDELTAIEADVSSTNLDNLDAELNAIDAELNAAIEAQ